ncbi:protein-associating with the carboxyl-terminal domain of ezrin [Drosophila tropicalis]|uniref:protein-associating with the carboxyl-terminal domain of ezrin n=1 Tax=Drosophila tropicalis TaxID=46794 RepID=UPI0035ABC675
MGNEGSKLQGLIIDKNAVEANDFWALYNAEQERSNTIEEAVQGGQLLSIFQGEILVKGQLWSSSDGQPIERAIKNLKIYRHPYILKYVTTWEKSGQKHLATERVRPLSDVLPEQSDIQLCLGLRTILCSLIFLIEKALARHLNIGLQSIYITDNGSWRLAGFEYVWKGQEINKQLLDLAINTFRKDLEIKTNIENFEQYSFASLCEQVLDKCGGPFVKEFRQYCVTHLKHQNTQLRPKLSAVLLHPYFNHEFVLIHSFLFELPLKSIQERQEFFKTLIERLSSFDEEMVANQLASDLLSRMVLLDTTAQHSVTPFVLRTKTTTTNNTNTSTTSSTMDQQTGLFSPQTYVKYLLPHILKMFRLKDAQIRMILLDFFMEYVRLLSDEQLKADILPHLQLGMWDTNEVLVAKTLRCMADLIPILGSTIVLGGERRRCFSDGRPHLNPQLWSAEPRSITPLMNGNGSMIDAEDNDFMVSGSPLPHLENAASLALRLSPDGGEDENEKPLEINQTSNDSPSKSSSSANSLTQHDETLVNLTVGDDEEEAWSDWDTTDELQRLNVIKAQTTAELEPLPDHLETNSSASTQATQDSYRTACSNVTSKSSVPTTRQPLIDDLNSLDIQVQLTTPTGVTDKPEFDFFRDMEPVIDNSRRSNSETDIVQVDASRFAHSLPADHEDDDNSQSGWAHDQDEDDDVVWGTTS